MSGAKLTVKNIGPSFADVFYATTNASVIGQMSIGATKAMRAAGLLLKQEGRANIRSGGLGSKFANAWRVSVYPSKKYSLHPAAYGKHNIDYADIFEKGGTIRGKRGMLWLPLPTVPKVGKRIARPRDLSGVKLFSIKGAGVPLLAAKIRSAGANRNSRIRGQVSLPTLRAGTDAAKIRKTAKLRGKKKGGVKASNATANAVTVPLFHGVPSVTLRRRFNLNQVAKQVSARLPDLYEQNLPKDK
jgi:hypothetical protein